MSGAQEAAPTVEDLLRRHVAASPSFAGLEPAAVDAIAAGVEWLALPGGAELFAAGEPTDAVYLVLSGLLGVYAADDASRPLARLGAGQLVGEMGLLSGRPRHATVRALRDSELARLPREAFESAWRRHPEVLLRLAQLVVRRFEHVPAPRPRAAARTFTLLPQSIEVDVGGFATELVAALGRLGRAELVWSVRGADHTSDWFDRVEGANDFVVYCADPDATTWTKLCVRQADALLLLARAEAPDGDWPLLAGDGARDAFGPRSGAHRAHLVLLHDGPLAPGHAARWRARAPGTPHHHVTDAADVARVARLLTGRAVGLVLSGGGARGFAHVGVVKALREAGVAIDAVGGTSMGAIMGAAVAADWSVAEMVERFRRTFVATNPLDDYTLPLVSLVSGRKVSRLLRQEFGEVAIEDLRLPFYAVSSNLSTGRGAVHAEGELWRWLRASIAIPGVLPPVFHGGEVHVDGGAINNLPVDVMRGAAHGVVVGVDVGHDPAFTTDVHEVDLPPLWKLLGWFLRHKRRPSILQILIRSGMVNSASATAARREQTDWLLQPPLADVDLLGWSAFDRAIAAGYRHARERLETMPPELAARLGL
jgi:NTE family protein